MISPSPQVISPSVNIALLIPRLNIKPNKPIKATETIKQKQDQCFKNKTGKHIKKN